MASLDHAMWFHRPFRADEWLLYDQDTPSASGGRGLGRGNIFTADGPPRRHRRAGGPDPGGPPMRRARGAASLGRRACSSRCTRRRPRGRRARPRRRPRRRPRPATPTDHHRPAAGADPRQRSSSALEEVAELDEPIALAARPGSPDLYIAEKGGRVRLIEGRRPTSSATTRRGHLRGPDHAAARHLRRGDQRGRAGPARHGVLERRPQALPRLHPPARRLHRRRRVRARRRATIDDDSRRELLVRRAALRQPQRRPARDRTRTATSTSASATAATAATPSATGRTPPPSSARSCASTPRPAPRTVPPTPSRPATRSPTATAGDPRSGSTACATRGGSRSTPTTGDLWVADVGPGRVRGDQPAARRGGLRRRQGRQPRMGPRWRAPTPSTAARTRDGARAADPSSTATTRAARSSAATCTAARRSPGSRAPTSSPTTAPPASAACSWTATRVIDTRTWDLPVERPVLVRPGRRRRAVRAPGQRRGAQAGGPVSAPELRHLATPDEWAAYQATGSIEPPSLRRRGVRALQHRRAARRHHRAALRGRRRARRAAPARGRAGRRAALGGEPPGETFPHVYRAIEIAEVAQAVPWRRPRRG